MTIHPSPYTAHKAVYLFFLKYTKHVDNLYSTPCIRAYAGTGILFHSFFIMCHVYCGAIRGDNTSITMHQKIVPNLWYNKEAEEAVDFYISIFNKGKVLNVSHYTEAGHAIHGMEAGTVLTVDFEIEGVRFSALNGGPHFTFSPAISFMVSCPTKEEVTELWEKLGVGGTALMPLDSYPFSERYGWIQDKYGVSWQLIFTQTLEEREILPSLLFTGTNYCKAEEAITFYTSVFDEDSAVGDVFRYGADQSQENERAIMYADFTLAGQKFCAMDSGYEHTFTLNEAVSLMVYCKTQEEIDYYWEKLSAVPQAEQCGWLKDTYGVSWQIVPTVLEELLSSTDTKKSNQVMEVLLQMKKLEISKLKEAYND